MLQDKRYVVTLLARTDDQADQARLHFTTAQVRIGYVPAHISDVPYNMILCYQIWWWGIAPFLDEAVKRNIPILHYDHGSLIHLSEYLLDNNEYASGYRNDIYRCSHIACWGERGKECWVSYGAPAEKLIPIGAIHLDNLHHPSTKDDSVHQMLHISPEKKIIFCYTALTGQIPHFDSAQIPFIERLEAFATADPAYQLVVKPHPSEMLWFDRPRYSFSPDTKLIANPLEDCTWSNITRISVEDVVAISTCVVSPFSSALLTPLSLSIPIILIQYKSTLFEDFASYCNESILTVTSAAQLPQAIELVSGPHQTDSSKLASQFNHRNDGNACTRLITLMEDILNVQLCGKQFYTEEEEELLESVKRYPFLPYPYQHLIKYYMKHGQDDTVDHWLDQYLQKFKDPTVLLKELAFHFYNVCNDYKRVQRYILLYAKYRQLDFELLHLYKHSYYFTLSERNPSQAGDT